MVRADKGAGLAGAGQAHPAESLRPVKGRDGHDGCHAVARQKP